jgi:sarcosine/dimethylglycine N-methyltransferase
MNPQSLHHRLVREQYSPASGVPFYRCVMGGGAPVIHYGIYDTPATSMREATETATRRLLGIAIERRGGAIPREIIDLGSGPGGAAHLLAAETGACVTCVDLCGHHNRENEAIARSLGLGGLIETWTGSFEQLPAEWTGKFGLAWSQEALCHSRDKVAFLREARRMLQPDGVLVFSDILIAENAPAGEAEAFSRVNAVVEWSTAAGLRRNLALAGFEDVVHQDWTPCLTENFRRMRAQITINRDLLLKSGVPEKLLDDFAASLDKRLAWPPGSVLQWGVFSCRVIRPESVSRPARGG